MPSGMQPDLGQAAADLFRGGSGLSETASHSGADNAASFTAFYTAYFDRLVAEMIARTRSRERAEEAVQDAFVAVYRVWDNIDAPDRYVRTVLRNSEAQRARERTACIVVGDFSDHGGVEGDVAEKVERRLTVVDAVRQLPEQQQRAMALYYLADRDVGDVADELGIAASTVRVHLAQARRRLYAQLQPQSVVSRPAPSPASDDSAGGAGPRRSRDNGAKRSSSAASTRPTTNFDTELSRADRHARYSGVLRPRRRRDGGPRHAKIRTDVLGCNDSHCAGHYLQSSTQRVWPEGFPVRGVYRWPDSVSEVPRSFAHPRSPHPYRDSGMWGHLRLMGRRVCESSPGTGSSGGTTIYSCPVEGRYATHKYPFPSVWEVLTPGSLHGSHALPPCTDCVFYEPLLVWCAAVFGPPRTPRPVARACPRCTALASRTGIDKRPEAARSPQTGIAKAPSIQLIAPGLVLVLAMPALDVACFSACQQMSAKPTSPEELAVEREEYCATRQRSLWPRLMSACFSRSPRALSALAGGDAPSPWQAHELLPFLSAQGLWASEAVSQPNVIAWFPLVRHGLARNEGGMRRLVS
ncbi:sigma-70 family RNA polymerase sigma factor, partial [Streptomyces sp. NPDC005336]|uniref:RNA polymerase sigma factor n=1 Tax=Streptomyces sp. NPDC005336 TaxID=3157035 RepID=UPI0033A4B5F0